MKSGIYQIRNTLTNKRYVGSTNDLTDRLSEHKRYLHRGVHGNKHLQAAFQKFGHGNFCFEIIEECNVGILLEREQYYIDLYKNLGLYNFNFLAAAPARGYRHTPEAIEKIRAASISRIGRTTFKKGLVPWSKGKKGLWKGSSTSFKKGFVPWNKNNKYDASLKSRLNLSGLEKGRGLFKGTKGIMKSNKTSFKKGIIPWNKKIHREPLVA